MCDVHVCVCDVYVCLYCNVCVMTMHVHVCVCDVCVCIVMCYDDACTCMCVRVMLGCW